MEISLTHLLGLSVVLILLVTSLFVYFHLKLNSLVNVSKAQAESYNSQLQNLKQSIEEKLEQLNASNVDAQAKQFDLTRQTIQGSVEALDKNVVAGFEDIKSTIDNATSELDQGLNDLMDGLLDGAVHLPMPVYHTAVNDIANDINSLGENDEVVVSKDGLIKHLTGFRVLRVEDQNNDHVTVFNYSGNQKVSSETTVDGVVKYKMTFDEFERPSLGIELDASGSPIFEYHYDESGEVSKRIDYAADGSVKTETVY